MENFLNHDISWYKPRLLNKLEEKLKDSSLSKEDKIKLILLDWDAEHEVNLDQKIADYKINFLLAALLEV